MAVLNNIRKHGVFLIVIIALALFAFILSSLIKNGGFSSGKSQNTIAVINDKDVSRVGFARRVEAAQQNSRQNQTTVQTVNQVWDATVRRTLLEQQIDELGIEVGDKQINEALQQQFGNNQNFSTNGQFDLNKLKGYLQQLKSRSQQGYQQWLLTEQQITDQAKINVYFDLVKAGIGATLNEGEEAYKLNNTSFDLQYVMLPYASVDDSKVEVTDGDISDYINANKKEFKTSGARDIRYVLFEEKPSSEDVGDIEKNLGTLLENHKTYNKAADADQMIKGFKNTDDYTVYLSENSDLPYNGNFKFKSDLPKAEADTLFNMDQGDIYGPYKEDGYWKYSKIVAQQQMPDSVKIKDILISYKGLQTGQGLERTKAEAEQLADSLLAVVQKDTAQFSTIAQTYSADPRSKDKDGDLGWLKHPKTNSDNPLVDFIFNNKPGSMKVLDLPYGYQIVKVEDTKNVQKVIKVATLAKKIDPSDKTLNNLFTETTKFQIAAKNGDFEKAAKAKEYKLRTVKGLEPMDEQVTGIGNQRNIVQWAFKDETEPGDIKRFDINQGYAVVQVTGETSAGLQTVEEASATVRPILLKKKKAKYLKDNISGKNLSAIAQNHNSKVETKNGVGFQNPELDRKDDEPKVVARAFSMKEGQVSDPIAGEKGVFVIKLIKTNNPGTLNSYNTIAIQETKKRNNQSAQQLFKALKDKAEIKDKRAKFY